MVFFQYEADILPEITLIGQDVRTGPHQNIRRVSDDYIFYIVTQGDMWFVEGETEYHLSKGDCFLFQPGVLHYGTRDSHYQIRYIHFRHPSVRMAAWENENVPSVEGMVTLPKQMHIADDKGMKRVLTSVGEAITHHYSRIENGRALCACSVHRLFLELYRLFSLIDDRGRATASRVEEVLAFLHTNYAQKLTGAVIEKELSYNFDYLNQLFRRAFDTSIFQMLETIRMEAARNLILTSDLSVERIALEVGFKDAAYFSKVFKKHYGTSPLHYRQAEAL